MSERFMLVLIGVILALGLAVMVASVPPPMAPGIEYAHPLRDTTGREVHLMFGAFDTTVSADSSPVVDSLSYVRWWSPRKFTAQGGLQGYRAMWIQSGRYRTRLFYAIPADSIEVIP
jgi:hypothetical protein